MEQQENNEAVEIIDIEEYSKSGRNPDPHAKAYLIRVDKEKIRVNKAKITGREILELAGKKPPEKYILRQVLRGGVLKKFARRNRRSRPAGHREVQDDAQDRARWATVSPLPEPRRQFRLPESDESSLDRLGVRWESIVENGLRWLLLLEVPLPAGYNHSTTDIAINIAPGYPPGALDMAYFCPPLARVDARPIPQTQAIQILDGRSWQRWSRHRTSQNPWVERWSRFGHSCSLYAGVARERIFEGSVMAQTTISLTAIQHQALHRHLFPGDGNEAVAIVQCGRRASAERHRLLVREINPVPYNQCTARSPVSVAWPTDLMIPWLQDADRRGLA